MHPSTSLFILLFLCPILFSLHLFIQIVSAKKCICAPRGCRLFVYSHPKIDDILTTFFTFTFTFTYKKRKVLERSGDTINFQTDQLTFPFYTIGARVSSNNFVAGQRVCGKVIYFGIAPFKLIK